MDWKALGKKIILIPIWLMILLAIVSTALLITVFVNSWEQTPLAYICYILSFYTLCTVTVFCVIVLPKQYGIIKQKIYNNPFGNRYMTDHAFRMKISLYLSLSISILYVVINLFSWYAVQSWWFVVLAVYYAIMAIMRFLLVRYFQKNKIGSSIVKEWRRARICAYILLLINLSLSGAVLMILYRNRGYDYPGILIYIMAMYTFYSTIHATMEFIRYRKLGSPVMTTARIVSLSAALVSMLNLETAMFAQFGKEMSPENQRIFVILTGAGVSITVITLSILLILRANRELKN